jgi:hypothetical protein
VIHVTIPPRHKSSARARHSPTRPISSPVRPSPLRRHTVLFTSRFSTGPQSSLLFSPAKQRNGCLSAASRSASTGQSAAELTSPPPSDDHHRMSPSLAVVFNRAPPPLLGMTVSELLHAGHLEFLLRPVRLPILLPLCRVQHHAEFPPLRP